MPNIAPDQMPGKTVHVAAAVIHHPTKPEYLIAQRPMNSHQGGLWEFPGGKVEEGETSEHTLIRELQEVNEPLIGHKFFEEIRFLSPGKSQRYLFGALIVLELNNLVRSELKDSSRRESVSDLGIGAFVEVGSVFLINHSCFNSTS